MSPSFQQVPSPRAGWFVAAGLVLVALILAAMPAANAASVDQSSGPVGRFAHRCPSSASQGLVSARLKLRAGRVAGSKLPGPRLSGSDKAGPPRPSCGVRGRPPCRTPPKIGDTAPPRPPECKSSRCPGGPPAIVYADPAPPGGGRFSANYLGSLPRISEGAGGRPELGIFFRKQVLVLLDQGQPAASKTSGAAISPAASQWPDADVDRGAGSALRHSRRPDGCAVVSVLAADPRVRLAQANFAYRRQGEANGEKAASSAAVCPGQDLSRPGTRFGPRTRRTGRGHRLRHRCGASRLAGRGGRILRRHQAGHRGQRRARHRRGRHHRCPGCRARRGAESGNPGGARLYAARQAAADRVQQRHTPSRHRMVRRQRRPACST